MKRRKQRKLNNYGYSLVEVLVAMTILAIAATAIFEFAIVASRHYRNETLEAEVQYEAQLAMNQIQDLLIDATEGVSYSYSAGGGETLILSDAGVTANIKYLTIYNDDRYYVLKWDGALEQIFYSEYRDDGTGVFRLETNANEALMAEFVRVFSVDISQLEDNHSVRLDVTFDNGREYQVTQNVTLRNKVVVNKPITEVYAE